MKKIVYYILFFLLLILPLKASEYAFEGVKYLQDCESFFCFNNGIFEIMNYKDDDWCIEKYPYSLKKEGAYLVANVEKETHIDKIYIFNADKRHLILYDCDENEVWVLTELNGYLDEPWIYSCFNYTASSYLSETLNGVQVDYVPENLAIQNLTQSWVEGVPGFGKGESISFRNGPMDGSRKIYIINGFFSPSKPSLFYDNNRIKTLKINCYKNGVLVETVERTLEDTGEMQLLEFPDRYKNFDFIIEDVYKGLKYNDTAITGIFLDALDVYDK